MDPEALMTTYLHALSGSPRVVGKPPKNIGQPWARLTVIDSPSIAGDGGTIDVARRCFFQIDCFAGTDGDQGDAQALSETIRSGLVEINHGAMSRGRSAEQISTSRVPDTAFEPAMECYVVTATVVIR